jgi:site-specific recombinase XerD
MSITLRKKPLKDGKRVSLYLDHYGEEGRRKEFLGLYQFKRPKDTLEKEHNKETQKLAENILSKRLLQANSEEHGFTDPTKRKVNFVEYFEKYAEGYTKKNFRTVHGALKYFKVYVGKDYLRPNEVTESLCHGFKQHLEGQLSGETPSTYFSRFKQMLRQAVRDKLFTVSPAAQVVNKAPKNQVRKDVLTLAELKTLAATPCGNETVRRAFLFSCMTGLRFVDVTGLQWKHVDEVAIRVIQSKTDMAVLISLNATARTLLGERGEPEAAVFPLPTANGTNKVLRYWGKRAGLNKHLSYHVARHSFACNLLINNADLYTVSDLLGHSDLTHTRKYLRPVEAMKQQAVNKLEFDL